jgi:inositol-pentakisphosphate 2-kinase
MPTTAPSNVKDLGPVPTLSELTDISYLAEGGANVVYRVSIRYPTPPPSLLEFYGEGTPPPTEIEDCEEYGGVERVDLSIFDSKFRFVESVPSPTLRNTTG